MGGKSSKDAAAASSDGASRPSNAAGNKKAAKKGGKSTGSKNTEAPDRVSSSGAGNGSGGVPGDITADNYPNFMMKARDTTGLSGKATGDTAAVTTNPLVSAEPLADYEQPQEISYSSSGPRAHSSSDIDLFNRSLDQVLSIWPEYHSLREVNPKNLRDNTFQTLQQVLKRLYEQHSYIRVLSEEKHQSRQAFVELEEERNAQAQQLRRREAEMATNKEDLSILRAELKRRSHDHVTEHQKRKSYQGPYDGHEKPPLASMHMYEPDEQSPSVKRKSKLIYQPTPLLQAEGDRTSASVKRSQSLRPVSNPPSAGDGASASPGSGRNYKADMNRLNHLELALDTERKENRELRTKLESKDSSVGRLGGGVMSKDKLVSRYSSLEDEALGSIYKIVDSQLGHVNEVRKRMFICAVMEMAHVVATDTLTQFRDVIQALLMNPVKPDVRQTPSSPQAAPAKRSSLLGQIKLFEGKPDERMSKLAKKTLATEEVPETLLLHVSDFLLNMSDVTNLTPLIENLIEMMSQQFPDCATSSLMTHPTFSRFLHSCCRLAWQMCVQSPPKLVAIENDMRFDERHHMTHNQDQLTNAKIDFYLWPIVYSRKNGDILVRGRVRIESHSTVL